MTTHAARPSAWWIPAACALFAPACRGRASSDDCHAMRDHYLDLAVRESPGAARMSPAQSAAVRDVVAGLKRAEPSYRRVEDRCGEVTRSEVSCAADAKTARDWEACLHPPDAGR